MTSPCLSLSNEPIFFSLEDKTTFDYEKYRRKFSIIRIGQLEYRGRKLQYSSDTKLWKISFPDALLHTLCRFYHFKGSFWNCQEIRKVSDWSSLMSQIKEGTDHRGGGERGEEEGKNRNQIFLFQCRVKWEWGGRSLARRHHGLFAQSSWHWTWNFRSWHLLFPWSRWISSKSLTLCPCSWPCQEDFKARCQTMKLFKHQMSQGFCNTERKAGWHQGRVREGWLAVSWEAVPQHLCSTNIIPAWQDDTREFFNNSKERKKIKFPATQL